MIKAAALGVGKNANLPKFRQFEHFRDDLVVLGEAETRHTGNEPSTAMAIRSALHGELRHRERRIGFLNVVEGRCAARGTVLLGVALINPVQEAAFTAAEHVLPHTQNHRSKWAQGR